MWRLCASWPRLRSSMIAGPAAIAARDSVIDHGVAASCAVACRRAAGAGGTTGTGVEDGATGGSATGAGVTGVAGDAGAGLFTTAFGFAVARFDAGRRTFRLTQRRFWLR